MDGRISGEQQVQVKVLIRPGLEPETSQPQRSALPLDHAGLVVVEVAVVVASRLGTLLRRVALILVLILVIAVEEAVDAVEEVDVAEHRDLTVQNV